MTKIDLLNRIFLPGELKAFLSDYPRVEWNSHPNFPNFAEFWLQRHDMFRKLGLHLVQLSQAILNNDIDTKEFQKQTLIYSGFMLQELHTHHIMEDTFFFPGIVKYDSKLSTAIDLLENDHQAISSIVNNYKVLLDELQLTKEASNCARRLLECQNGFNEALKRHLEDEEDIIVPAALHYGFIR